MNDSDSSSREVEEILELLEEDTPLDLVTLLRRSLGEYLPEKEILKLKDEAILRKFTPPDPLFKEGEEGKEWGVIGRGVAEIRGTYGGEVRRVGFLYTGEIVGEVAVLKGVPRTATVIAAEPLEAFIFPARRLQELVQTYPRFREYIEKLIYARAEATVRALEETGTSS